MFSIFSKKSESGFTLIEMLVVIAIFTIITAIILFNLPSFQGSTNLDLVAQEVALHIRGAQLYTTATRASIVNISAGGTENKYLSYGIHFDLRDETSRSSFGLYGFDDKARPALTDPDGYKMYQKQPGDKNVEIYHLPKGYEISRVCVGGSSNSCEDANGDYCSDLSGGTKRFLDIAFVRPNPEPHVCVYDTDTSAEVADCVNHTNPFNLDDMSARATICIKAKRVNLQRMIEINPGGQIVVNKPV